MDDNTPNPTPEQFTPMGEVIFRASLLLDRLLAAHETGPEIAAPREVGGLCQDHVSARLPQQSIEPGRRRVRPGVGMGVCGCTEALRIRRYGTAQIGQRRYSNARYCARPDPGWWGQITSPPD